MIREILLQQNAFHEIDTFSELKKSYLIMKTILHFSKAANESLDRGARVQSILDVKSKDKLAEVKFVKEYEKFISNVVKDMDAEFGKL